MVSAAFSCDCCLVGVEGCTILEVKVIDRWLCVLCTMLLLHTVVLGSSEVPVVSALAL
jgi:hypothetical protein